MKFVDTVASINFSYFNFVTEHSVLNCKRCWIKLTYHWCQTYVSCCWGIIVLSAVCPVNELLPSESTLTTRCVSKNNLVTKPTKLLRTRFFRFIFPTDFLYNFLLDYCTWLYILIVPYINYYFFKLENINVFQSHKHFSPCRNDNIQSVSERQHCVKIFSF